MLVVVVLVKSNHREPLLQLLLLRKAQVQFVLPFRFLGEDHGFKLSRLLRLLGSVCPLAFSQGRGSGTGEASLCFVGALQLKDLLHVGKPVEPPLVF